MYIEGRSSDDCTSRKRFVDKGRYKAQTLVVGSGGLIAGERSTAKEEEMHMEEGHSTEKCESRKHFGRAQTLVVLHGRRRVQALPVVDRRIDPHALQPYDWGLGLPLEAQRRRPAKAAPPPSPQTPCPTPWHYNARMLHTTIDLTDKTPEKSPEYPPRTQKACTPRAAVSIDPTRPETMPPERTSSCRRGCIRPSAGPIAPFDTTHGNGLVPAQDSAPVKPPVNESTLEEGTGTRSCTWAAVRRIRMENNNILSNKGAVADKGIVALSREMKINMWPKNHSYRILS